MGSIQEQVISLGTLIGLVPGFVYEQDRLLLMAISALAAAAGVGAVTRNHELGTLSRIVVALLIFVVVIGLCLLAAYSFPILAEMGRRSHGGAQ